MRYLYSSKVLYENICLNGKHRKQDYKRGSGLHKHHIIPKHSGGSEDIANFTFLTVREHIIAHYLLWRVYKNPDDLRSMKMLGAKLTPFQRSVIGKFCRDNKIGFFGATDSERDAWRKLGLKTQQESESKNTFYYWSTKAGQKERASMGGKASISSGNNKAWQYWASPEGIKERASMGGKAHMGKRCMYKPGDTTFKRVKAEDIDVFLNNGYVFGSPIPSKNKITKISS